MNLTPRKLTMLKMFKTSIAIVTAFLIFAGYAQADVDEAF
jgi:hypothetical protein